MMLYTCKIYFTLSIFSILLLTFFASELERGWNRARREKGGVGLERSWEEREGSGDRAELGRGRDRAGDTAVFGFCCTS